MGTAAHLDTHAAPSARIQSIDVVRGIVMVLMAIDHVRVFAAVPAGSSTDAAVFLTRWITHFCAPAFVFLAGTSAYLHLAKTGDRGGLSRFLVSRGLVLVLLELTVFRFSWTFNMQYASYSLAGVIWMLGWCMVLLAALIWLPTRVLAALGILLVAGHNLLGASQTIGAAAQASPAAALWQILYYGGEFRVGGLPVIVLYTLVPWVGVMALGFVFGRVMQMPAPQRAQWCTRAGLALIALFVLLRAVNGYGDPRPWSTDNGPAWISFLSTTKYPASLLFVLMTLGPTILALALVDRTSAAWARVASVFGRVPMFYYLLHIAFIHLVLVGLSLVRFGTVIPWMTANHPMNPGPAPDGYMLSLPALYAITVAVVIALYVPCRWYANARATRPRWWMSYL